MRHVIFAAAAAIVSFVAPSADAQILEPAKGGCCGEVEPLPSFGPGCCEPRGTLFQWSYGTSFSGGPDREEPLVTDRPDFTESSVTVGRGVVQLEMGYTYSYDEEGGAQTIGHSIGEPLLRVGIFADWLELRLATNYAQESTRPAGGARTVENGFEDLAIGTKIGLTPQECWLPEMALLLELSVPTGDAAFSADEVLPGGVWAYGWEITERISAGGNTGLFKRLDDMTNEEFTLFTQSVAVGYSLTDRLGSYTEWFALVPSGADTVQTQHFFNGGFTFLVNNDLQLDVSAGVGLSDASDDYFIGTGFAVRR